MKKNIFKTLISITCITMTLLMLSTTCFASQVYKGPISFAEEENGEVEFINSNATNYIIEFADQGKVEWTGVESGLKDFTFSLVPNEELSEKYEGVEFISFENTPSFSTTVNVSLAMIVDNTDPALYVVDENNEIFRIPDVEIVKEKNSTFFNFKEKKLAKTYMLSPVVIPNIPDLDRSEFIEQPVIEEPTEEVVQELPAEETKQEATDSPKTAADTDFATLCLIVGILGMLSIIVAAKKKN